jgi:RNA-directed DNA polymerase
VSILVVVVLLYVVIQVVVKYRPRKISRDVSRLATEDQDSDATAATTEVVETEGGPLKPLHRRRALRDLRLLPKPRPPGPVWQRPKKRKVMEMDEATRLFAGTLRNRDRNVRDLRTDEEQLARYGLPKWNSEAEVAEALNLSVKRLRHYSVHREKERVSHYVQFAIPKRSGGERIILAPKRELKAVLRELNSLLVDKLPVSEYAHGFRKGRSIATHAAEHVGKKVVMRLDLKDFFPSLHVGRVRGLLIALGYSYPVGATLAALMTEAVRQPVQVGDELFFVPIGSRHTVQGAPTSPGLANALATPLDRRLAGLARKLGFAYSRYADDLTFSGDDVAAARGMIKGVQRIVHAEGFVLNPAKTRVMTQRGAQVVTGATVNRELGLSRRERRNLRAELHRARTDAKDSPVWRRLQGKLAYLSMLNSQQADRLRGAGGKPGAPG